MWISSDSANEYEEKIDADDTDSSDSDMLESMNSLACKFWDKRKLHINTYFAVTIWILCVINLIHKDEKLSLI